MNNTKIRVFSDFDGTITVKDLGDEIFRVLGEFRVHNDRLKRRELDIKDYWKILAGTIEGTPKEKVLDIIDNAEIDPYFVKFAEFCESEGLPLTIVSDGFDIYIRRILDKIGFGHLPVYCNELKHEPAGDIYSPHYTWASESCNCFCASCKRNSVINNASEDDIIVFIGDGYSDYCAAEHSDIIFAKKFLAAYCNEEKLPHYPYTTFFDVLRTFKNIILAQNKIKRRNHAVIKRKQAFEGE